MSFESDKEAKNFAGAFVTENKSRLEETKGKLSLDNLFDQIQASDLKELPIIVKADVQGSVYVVKQSLTKLSNEEVIVKVIHGGVGAINESDVSLCRNIQCHQSSDLTYVRIPRSKTACWQEGVDLRLYKVIYQHRGCGGSHERYAGSGIRGESYRLPEVRQLFKASGVGTIAGSMYWMVHSSVTARFVSQEVRGPDL